MSCVHVPKQKEHSEFKRKEVDYMMMKTKMRKPADILLILSLFRLSYSCNFLLF